MKALITGAGSGIGRGIALGLAKRGVAIGLVGRRAETLAETAMLAAPCAVETISLPCDLTLPDQRKLLLERVRQQLGTLDILVNNAAILHSGALSSQQQDASTATVETNLTASIDLLRLFLPDLAASRGVAAFISSSASLVPLPYLSLYSASKAGLDAFARSVQYELRRQQIHTLIAYPPATATAMTDGMATAANVRWFSRADPLWVGDKIAAGILARRRIVDLQRGEQILAWLYRLAPGWVMRILQWQAVRFEQMTRLSSDENAPGTVKP
ncbi:MAG: SDR family oxidoreductase [Caldilineaceae bacterium]